MRRLVLVLSLLASVTGAGCGKGEKPAPALSSPPAASKADPTLPAGFAAASHPSASAFPPSRGQTLQQLADRAKPGAQVGLAASQFTPGRNRLPFALLDEQARFVYAPAAVYIAPTPSSPAQGPFVAPADSLLPAKRYRSLTAGADPDTVRAVYSASVPFSRPGRWSVLALVREGGKLTGAASQVDVAARSAIPGVGQRPPRITTPTLTSVHGRVGLIDTRTPPGTMHGFDFARVLGHKPIALVIATPALCQSKVCGPVVDVAEELKATYGSRVDFIHQEVYRDNQLQRGYRPQLQAFRLRTEPWIFLIDRRGRIAKRFEGPTGIAEFRRGLDETLRR